MKILGISMLMMGLLMMLSLGIDLFQGFDKKTSINNVINPFEVMELPELGVLILFILILITNTSKTYYKNRKAKEQ